MATLACRVTRLKCAQPGHGAIRGAKFGQNLSTLSTRYAVHRQTNRHVHWTDNKGHLKTTRSNMFTANMSHLKTMLSNRQTDMFTDNKGHLKSRQSNYMSLKFQDHSYFSSIFKTILCAVIPRRMKAHSQKIRRKYLNTYPTVCSFSYSL